MRPVIASSHSRQASWYYHLLHTLPYLVLGSAASALHRIRHSPAIERSTNSDKTITGSQQQKPHRFFTKTTFVLHKDIEPSLKKAAVTMSSNPSNSYEVVKAIPNDQARAILLSLCTNPAICAKVASYAKRLDEEAASKKRKPDSTIAICVQCDQPYYEEDNDDSSCVHHDGELSHKFYYLVAAQALVTAVVLLQVYWRSTTRQRSGRRSPTTAQLTLPTMRKTSPKASTGPAAAPSAPLKDAKGARISPTPRSRGKALMFRRAKPRMMSEGYEGGF